MNIITKLRSTIDGAASAGAKKFSDLRDDQRRKALFAELGELRYREHQGETIDSSGYASVLTDLDQLSEQDGEPPMASDEGVEAASEDTDES